MRGRSSLQPSGTSAAPLRHVEAGVRRPRSLRLARGVPWLAIKVQHIAILLPRVQVPARARNGREPAVARFTLHAVLGARGTGIHPEGAVRRLVVRGPAKLTQTAGARMRHNVVAAAGVFSGHVAYPFDLRLERWHACGEPNAKRA